MNFPRDKVAHVVIGAIAAGCGGLLALAGGLEGGHIAICAAVASVGIGIARELIQASMVTGTAEGMDAVATAAGGLVVAAVIWGAA